MTSAFKRVKVQLNDIAKAERAFDRERRKKCDWEDPEDVALYKQEQYQALRLAVLNELVPTRVCPGPCGQLRLSSREWVVSTDRKAAMCRRCFHNRYNKPGGAQILDLVLFPATMTRYKLDGGSLTLARVKTELSVRAFAHRAGWSLSYQRKLEDVSSTVNEATARAIITVLQECGVTTKDILQ